MTYEEALQIAMEELDEKIEHLSETFKGHSAGVESYIYNLSMARKALIQALKDAETDRLRAKKKQICEDLKSEQTHNTKGEVTYDPETGEPLIDGYPLYSGLPKREWVGLTYNEIIDTSNEFQVLDKGESEPWFDLVGYASAIEAKLKEKNT